MIKGHKKNLIALLTIIALSINAVGISLAPHSLALTYQDDMDVEFTFNSSVSLSLSSPELTISSLAPSTYGDSNIITITTSTNNPAGCTLYATTGNGSNYANTDLIDGKGNSFTSLATNSAMASMENADPGKWGYSFSTDSGTTWINANGSGYSGLPYYNNEGVTLLETNINGSSSLQFKIGAKSGPAQASGTYKNVINFVTTSNPVVYYMQDVATWGPSLTTNEQVQAVDRRDGKTYYVAKLADGNIWMTQNLDHDIGDIAGGTYTPADTDIPANWTPSSSEYTYASNDSTWNRSLFIPESYDPGDLCWGATLDEENFSFHSLEDETVACDSSNIHYHIGNYYNWTAAVAMSSSSSYTTDNQDVNQSICPAGWRLPIGGTTNTGTKSFQYLVDQLGLTSGNDYGNIQDYPVYFVYGGYWYGNSIHVDYSGTYLSSVTAYDESSPFSSVDAYGLHFNGDGFLEAQNLIVRTDGNSVRCVAR